VKCRGGAWGSTDRCAVHEGLPLDPTTGLCEEGRPHRAGDVVVPEPTAAPLLGSLFPKAPEPPSDVVWLGNEERMLTAELAPDVHAVLEKNGRGPRWQVRIQRGLHVLFDSRRRPRAESCGSVESAKAKAIAFFRAFVPEGRARGA